MNEILKTLIDKDTIINIRVRFTRYIDTKDWKGLTTLLSDRVDVDYSDFGIPIQTMTREEFVGLIRNTLSREGVRTQHYISNFDISVEGDNATCQAHVRAMHFLPNEGESMLEMGGYYEAKLVRIAQDWKIKSWKFTILWSRGNEELFELSKKTPSTAYQ